MLIGGNGFVTGAQCAAGDPHSSNRPRGTMQRVKKSVLVPHSSLQMFELVERVEDYPSFLPWCGGTQVLSMQEDGKTARVDINYHGVRAHFTTENAYTRPTAIMVMLKDGPFRHLHGEWLFTALSEDACKVEFGLVYEFATPLLATVIGPVFNHIVNTFVDAFVRRAESVYPPGG
jgi:ribosome-associated toxin RatA of RatAB toxin-antitoxin module